MTLGPKSWIIFTVSDFSNWTLAWSQFIPPPHAFTHLGLSYPSTQWPSEPPYNVMVVQIRIAPISDAFEYSILIWWCYLKRFRGCSLVEGSMLLEADFESLETHAVAFPVASFTLCFQVSENAQLAGPATILASCHTFLTR